MIPAVIIKSACQTSRFWLLLCRPKAVSVRLLSARLFAFQTRANDFRDSHHNTCEIYSVCARHEYRDEIESIEKFRVGFEFVFRTGLCHVDGSTCWVHIRFDIYAYTRAWRRLRNTRTTLHRIAKLRDLYFPHSSSCAARSLTRNIGDGGCAAHRAALGATGPEELFGTRRRRDKSVALLRPRVSEDGGHRVVFGVSARLPSATRRQMKRPSVIKSNAGHGRPR